jgi:V8-like Glu-specific endopeptidase
MRHLFLAALLLAPLHAAGEARFEVLRLESSGTGDLLSVIDLRKRTLTAEEARVEEELRGFYLKGELEYVSNYRSGRMREVARNTGLLEVLHADNVARGCTATAITDQLLLTNSHCVPLGGEQRAVGARFFLGFESDDPAILGGLTGISVELPAVEKSDVLDYAVLRLSESIPGYLPLQVTNIRDPSVEEKLVILGFPGGQPLSVSGRNCRTTEQPILEATVLHLCRTYEGNSGSLLFADDWSLVGLHHAGIYDDVTGEKTELSHGIRMTAILEESPILRGLFGIGEDGQIPPSPAIDAAVDAEAALALDVAARREIQRNLSVLGFDVGRVDGVFGQKTRQAISEWQESNRLTRSSYLDAPQVQKIREQAVSREAIASTKLPRDQAERSVSAPVVRALDCPNIFGIISCP